MDEQKLMKLKTVVVYDSRTCMENNNPGLENINRDHSLCGTRV